MFGDEAPPRLDENADSSATYKVPNTVPWFSRFVYKCDECDFTSFTRNSSERHRRLCPEVADGQVAGKSLVSKPIYSCLECGAKVYHAEKFIQRHLRRAHDASLEEYGAKFGLQRRAGLEDSKRSWFDGCVYTCNECGQAFNDVPTVVIHLKNFHKRENAGAGGEGYSASETKHDCAICGISVLRSSFRIKLHLSRMHGGMSIVEYAERYVDHRSK